MAIERAPSSEVLRIRVLDAVTGERTTRFEVGVAELHSTPQARSTRFLARAFPSGEERELRFSRAELVLDAQFDALQIGIGGIFDPLVETHVPLDPWPGDPIELVLPPCGFLKVRTLDERGELDPREGKASLDLALRSGSQSAIRMHIERGETVAQLCALDVELQLSAELAGGTSFAPRRVRGPRQPGETKVLLLRAEPAPSAVRVRLLDERHQPIAAQRVRVGIRHWSRVGTQVLEGFGLTSSGTDERGWIVVAVDRSLRSAAIRRVLQAGCDHAEFGGISGALEITAELPPGITELGDLVLARAPITVAGSVVDAEGRAVPRAAIALEHRELHEEMLRTIRLDADAKGRFVWAQERPVTQMRLRAHHQGYAPSPWKEVPTGTQDVRIELQAPAVIAGWVQLPRGLAPDHVRIAILAQDGDRTPGISHAQAALDGEQRFLASTPISGLARVHFQLRSGGELAVVEDVQLSPGTVNRDPRLQGLALGNGWRPLELELVDPENAGARFPSVLLCRQDSREPAWLEVQQRHWIRTWVDPADPSLVLRVAGYRDEPVRWTAESQRVVLRRAPRVRVPVDWPAHESIHAVHVELSDPNGRVAAEAEVLDGLALLPFPSPGRYRVRCDLVVRHAQTGARLSIDHSERAVELRDEPEMTLPTFTITQAMIEAALAPR